ncbi:exodeoxyribonuclease VII large subunit [Porphyromonas pogonae]|uniref:exodeoxyribonuclease VII large subunit n=1 Tax=Porphyromonas pogonae TaxID=867595 RepID=UPI002E797611|nr:exodeoxyribonuclease VII large subunit [Porphyromonas pogonae]
MPTPTYSLLELNSAIRKCLESGLPGQYWVRAETSDVRVNMQSGHCYMELLEKGKSGNIVAKVRAMVWSHIFKTIDHEFKKVTGVSLDSGMSILALVSISFHEQFGLSLVINNVDPAYTLGDVAKLRQEVILRLQKNGIFDLNRELPLPRLIRKIAIISSPTAAGYEDFMRHLTLNEWNLKIYTKLFPAKMQGDQTEDSVLSALDRIAAYEHIFDAVVIIRGGGAVSELRAFDSYALCEACAQYPLPVICGIGHERDQSVLDLVANVSMKTPTAVADFLMMRLYGELEKLVWKTERLANAYRYLMAGRYEWIGNMSYRLPLATRKKLHDQHRLLQNNRKRLSMATTTELYRYNRQVLELSHRLPAAASRKISGEFARQSSLTNKLSKGARQQIYRSQTDIQELTYRLPAAATRCISTERGRQDASMRNLRYHARRMIRNSEILLHKYNRTLPHTAQNRLERYRRRLDVSLHKLPLLIGKHTEKFRVQLDRSEQAIRLSNPKNILKKGFALVYDSEGRLIRSVENLHPGDKLRTDLHDGTAISTVQELTTRKQ